VGTTAGASGGAGALRSDDPSILDDVISISSVTGMRRLIALSSQPIGNALSVDARRIIDAVVTRDDLKY